MTQTPVAFVIAMPEEAAGILPLASWEQVAAAPFPLYRRTWGGAGGGQAMAAVSGIGTTNAAAATQHVLDRFAPARVVNMGVVGCLNHAIPIGAVHAVSTCVFFDVDATAFGYRIGQIPQTEVHEYELAARAPRPMGSVRVMSGDTFVTGRDGFHPELAGFAADFVDMELASIAHTMWRNEALGRLESYKAPSDYCDSESPEVFDQNMPAALRELAGVADQILAGHGLAAEPEDALR